MKKSVIVSTILLVMVALFFVSCSGNEESNAGSGEKTVIRVQMIGDWTIDERLDRFTGDPIEGLGSIEADFEAKNPTIDLEYVLMGWDDYTKKTQAMLLSNQADVYQVPGIASFAAQGLLEPLQSYIDNDENFDIDIYLGNQVDGWLAMGPEDDGLEIYGLPLLGDTRVIVYDKQLFDEWGVEYLSDNPSLAEITEKASKMTGINPVSGEMNYGVTWRGSDTADTMVNIAESYGEAWGTGFMPAELEYNFSSPTMVKALEDLKSLLPYAPEGVMVNAGIENFGRENNDIAIHLRAGPLELYSIEFLGLGERFEVANLFVHPETGTGGLFVGSPISIASNSKVKDAAWEYVKYTAGDTFQSFIIRNRELACVDNVLEYEGIKGIDNLEKMAISAGTLWGPRYPYRAGTPRGILSAAVESAINGTLSAQEALNSAQADSEKWSREQ